MLKELKTELKSLAAKIRKERAEHKAAQRAGTCTYAPDNLSYTYRHKHIVYCLLRGRTREQIENKVREDNKPNEDYIQELLVGYQNHIAIKTGTLARQEPITDLKRLYVIVDETLPRKYAVGQAGHAIAQFMLENPTPELGQPKWANEVLVILKAPHHIIERYSAYGKKATSDHLKWVSFSEPDLDNRLTAVASVQKIDSQLVKSLSLLYYRYRTRGGTVLQITSPQAVMQNRPSPATSGATWTEAPEGTIFGHGFPTLNGDPTFPFFIQKSVCRVWG